MTQRNTASLEPALAHHRAGRLEEASAAYSQVLELDPAHAGAQHLLGVVAFQRGSYGEAVRQISEAIALDSKQAAFHNNLGNALKGQEDFPAAEAAYRRALELNPGYVMAWANLGTALQAQARAGEAAEAYRQALALQPESPAILNHLGVTLQSLGDHASAVETFDQALRLEPHYAQALTNRGVSRLEMGEPDAAAGDHRRALAAAPQLHEAHANLADVLCEKGEKIDAINGYRRALDYSASEAGTRTKTLNSLGSVLASEGRLDEALESYQQALADRPDNLRALSGIASVCWAQGNGPLAREAYERVIALDPALAEARVGLAKIAYDSDPAMAVEQLTAALASDPAHAVARFYLAVALEKLGDGASARKHFERVAAEAPHLDFLLDSAAYAGAVSSSNTRSFADAFATLDFALEAATLDGEVLEFGVLYGASLRVIAKHFSQTVHGFDSFEGLPEAWGRNKAGAYSTQGFLPSVPHNAQLHAGWFEDTLPAYLAAHSGPVRFLNIDCDLYSSTKTVLTGLADRIVPGTVILFDEYLSTARWREDEYKAFQEAAAQRGWQYEYLAFNLFSKQAIVRIL